MEDCSDIQLFGKLYIERDYAEEGVDNIKRVVCVQRSDAELVIKTFNGWSKKCDVWISSLDWLEMITEAPFGKDDVKIRVKRFKIPDKLISEMEDFENITLDIENSIL